MRLSSRVTRIRCHGLQRGKQKAARIEVTARSSLQFWYFLTSSWCTRWRYTFVDPVQQLFFSDWEHNKVHHIFIFLFFLRGPLVSCFSFMSCSTQPRPTTRRGSPQPDAFSLSSCSQLLYLLTRPYTHSSSVSWRFRFCSQRRH